MKDNFNTLIIGRHVSLLPYTERHVTKHHAWMQVSGNRLDRTKTAPTFEQEQATQAAWANDPKRCVFLIMDSEAGSDLSISEMTSLIGECHLIISSEAPSTAVLEMMCTDGTVRRKSIISESLLLLLQYAVSSLKLDTFNVHLDPTAEPSENRLIFGAREESEESAAAPPQPAQPPPELTRKDSKSGGLVNRLSKVFKSSKTDYLHRLTRHLLKQDEGDHWPEELDFVLTAPNFLELKIDAAAMRALMEMSRRARVVQYASIRSDGKLRCNFNTVLLSDRIALVPYTPHFVPRVHAWMQIPDMYVAFGLLPPSIEQERMAQSLMAHDPGCFSFVVCKKDGTALSPIGRAQLHFKDALARIHIGLPIPDLGVRVSLQREVLALITYFSFVALPIKRVHQPAASAVKPGPDSTGFGAIPYAPGDGGDLVLDLSLPDVRAKLFAFGDRFNVAAFFPSQWSISDASDI